MRSRQHWESDQELHTPAGRYMHGRWPEGSLYVLDIDHSVFSTDYRRGLLIEWKHINAQDKKWRATRHLARCAGYYAALIEHELDANMCAVPLYVTWMKPDGTLLERIPFDADQFDRGVLRAFGNGTKST